MRAVLYSDIDMEPITVIDLKQWAWDILWQGEPLFLVPPPELDFRSVALNPLEPVSINVSKLRIWGEPLRRRDQSALMLFVDNDVVAMRMKSELLPGQRRDDIERQRQAFGEGIMAAIDALRGGL